VRVSIAVVPPTRKTYVVSVQERGGPATVEEVRSGRKARLGSLSDTGAQIERWLRDPEPAAAAGSRAGRPEVLR
jgi:hypothetical protein